MGKNIGIKLADGSFYPILEEGVPKKKLLELTTVQDNQTTIMVDLYSSETNSMADAQYVDTLQISSLIPHPEGEPNICLSVQIDENNVLSAEVSDAESGTSSNTSVELISRTEAERAETPNPIEDVTLADENAFADDSFPAEFEDTIPESEVLDMPLNSSELDSLPDFDEPQPLQDSNNFADNPSDNFNADLPDFDNITDSDNTVSNELEDSSFDADFSADSSELDSLPDFDEPQPLQDSNNFADNPSDSFNEDLPDFDNIADSDNTVSNELEDSSFDADFSADSSQLDSLPDFDEPQPLQDSNNFADNPSDSFNADLPDFDNITDSDNTVSNELEDSSFDTDFSADSSELDSLPDFDEPQPLQDSNNFANDSSDNFNADLPDFDNITDSDNTVSNELEDSSFDTDFSANSSELDSLPDFDEPQPLQDSNNFTDNPSDSFNADLPDFDNIADSDNTVSNELEDSSFDADFSADSSELDSLPDFDETQPLQDSNNFADNPSDNFNEDLPDFDNITDSDNTVSNELEDSSFDADFSADSSELDSLPDFDDTPSLSDSILSDYAETINVRESSLPDFSKFELPDFDDQPQEDDYIGNNRLFDESDFDDPAFQVQNQQEQNAGFDFSGLYDDPEENKTEKKKHKNTAAVVICIICALICLATLGIILFFLPSQISIDITKKNPSTEVIEINQTETEIINEQNITELKDIPLPPQPEPKEDVIVISETPAVVPIVPPEPEKEIDVVVYKIKWGDTLWDLAETYYNNPWLYKKIASANNITNPDHIISGTEIIIPAK